MYEKLMYDNFRLYQYFLRLESQQKEEVRRKRAEDDGPNHAEASEIGDQQ